MKDKDNIDKEETELSHNIASDLERDWYVQAMNNYRYLANQNVKYMMFFFLAVGIFIKFRDAQAEQYSDLKKLVIIMGLYVFTSVALLAYRVYGMKKNINHFEKKYVLYKSNFNPFIIYLITSLILILAGVLIVFGITF